MKAVSKTVHYDFFKLCTMILSGSILIPEKSLMIYSRYNGEFWKENNISS